jgi:F-type H+-transporting ATPase subunit k
LPSIAPEKFDKRCSELLSRPQKASRIESRFFSSFLKPEIARYRNHADSDHLQLAMATLGVVFTGAFLSVGGKKIEDPTSPPINAKSKDEESFVKYVDATLHLPR